MLDLEEALDTAVQAVQEAGRRILKGFSEPLEVRQKSQDPADRVTQVDIDCERIVMERILKAYPDHDFLSEEGGGGVGPVGEEYSSPTGRGARWVLDPLDGTSNFIHRLPHVGVSLALEINGEVQLGVMHLPVFSETYTAIRGKGAKKNGSALRPCSGQASLTTGGKDIRVSPCAKLSDALIMEVYSDRIHRGKKVTYPPCKEYRRYGSAVSSLALVADGRVHGTVLHCYWWDIAAAQVIIPEAGGKVTWWPLEDARDEHGHLLCIASSPEIHEELLEFVREEYSSPTHCSFPSS